MKIKKFISDIKERVSTGSKALVSSILYKEDKKLIALLKKYSPVDSDPRTIDDTVFKENWVAGHPRLSGSKSLATLVIKNSTPDYGHHIAFGADPVTAPWYFPHRDKKGKYTKQTGKLVAHDGKIWAGKKHLGSKAKGGPIANAMAEYTDKFTQEFADKFVKGFL